MKLRQIRHNRWNIGFIESNIKNALNLNSNSIHWAKKKFTDRWFADPFILDYDEKEIIILAEEFDYDLAKGRIARVIFDRKTYEEVSFEIILELPLHLSFPFIIRKEKEIYLMPENSLSGHSTIFKYEDSTRIITPIKQISNQPFTDATIIDIVGSRFLLTTQRPDPNGNNLSIYKFNYNTFSIDNVPLIKEFSSKKARNAGEFFTVDDKIYRPAQDCNKCYGHGVIIQEIIKKGDCWEFEDKNSFYPTNFNYNLGIHTLNHYKDLIVFDCNGYRYPILGRIANMLLSLIGK